MKDIIKILSDNISNQIAAGEVVQRPASVVKELIENSVDAGSSFINISIENSGKTLIRVEDNGKGMTHSDARLCFEKHATSKISKVEDLYNIKTMGFRGEALPSIASVARVTLKTKHKEETNGTMVQIEGSEIKNHSIIPFENGTSISVRSLFFNTPARRNFFKSDKSELNQIISTFLRVAIVNPKVEFSLTSNGRILYKFEKADNYFERIEAAFGNRVSKNLIKIKEKTEVVEVIGWVSKPDTLIKSYSHEYFFLNDRFIKSPYLKHAISKAYEQFVYKKVKLNFFIYLFVPSNEFDINVHPTKTEAKFKNDKEIYSILSVAIKSAINKFSIAPSIDFDRINTLNSLGTSKSNFILPPQKSFSYDYNPFKKIENTSIKKSKTEFLNNTYKNISETFEDNETTPNLASINIEQLDKYKYHIVSGKYVLFEIENGLLIINVYKVKKQIDCRDTIKKWKKEGIIKKQLLIEQEYKEKTLQKSILINKNILEKIGFSFKVKNNNVVVKETPYFVDLVLEDDLVELLEKIEEIEQTDINQLYDYLYKKFYIKTIPKKTKLEKEYLLEIAKKTVRLVKEKKLNSFRIIKYIENNNIEKTLF